MAEHSFTLVIDGDVDAHLEELYEAGCDDATFGQVDGVHYADFDREADTLTQAIASAIAAVESVKDLRVVRVEPDDLVSAAEIAGRLHRSRQSVKFFITGERGPGGFPAPVSHLRSRSRLWRWSDVLAWFGELDDEERGNAELVAAVNATLEVRARAPGLDREGRSLVSSLRRRTPA